MSKQTFLQGTITLILAGMITRFLGFVNRLVVARLMGEEGVGLYMMALPTLFLIITLTQLGLPVAISKRVAEAEARGAQTKVKRILVVSLILTGCASIIFTIGMIFISPIIAKTLLTDSRTIYPLLAISPIVPIIALSSVIKGYFQGKQDMKPQSFAQVIEQIIRITCVALFVKLLLPYGVEFAAAGAMFSVILGEGISLLYLFYHFKRGKPFKIRYHFFGYLKSSKDTLQELLSIALPSTGSRLIGSFSNFLEPIIVAQSLAIAGVSAQLVTKQYGELTGYVMPLLFLPTFITQSLAVALVPSISEADAIKNHKLIHYRVHQAIRISFASGGIATIILTLFSEPILTYMYGSGNASHFLVLMAPFYILLYIQSPLQAALHALDLAKPAMINSLIGSTVKLAVLFALASNTSLGMKGVAVAMCVGVVLITLLHLFTLKKTIHFYLPIKDILKMIVLLGLTWWVGSLLKGIYANLEANLLTLLSVFSILTLFYIAFLILLNFITKDEFKQIPIIKRWL